MPYAYNEYTSDGFTTDYLISFTGVAPGYLSEDHVKYYLNGVLQSDSERTFIDSTHVQITAPTSGSLVRFQRESSIETPVIDWSSGEGVTSFNLDSNTLQMLYVAMENADKNGESSAAEAAASAAEAAASATAAENAVGIELYALSNYSNNLETALTQIGSSEVTLLIDQTPDDLTADLTIPPTVALVWNKGCTLGGAFTLTINGALTAGDYKIFNSNLTIAGLRTSNVKWFGAVGDGTTDDLYAFTNCIAATSGDITVPYNSTNYILSDSWVISKSISVKGAATVLEFIGDGIDIDTNVVVHFDDFVIHGGSSIPATSYTGLHIGANRYSTFTNLRVRGFEKGIDFYANKFSMKFDSCLIEYNDIGVVMQNANNNNLFLNCTIENNNIGVDMAYLAGGAATTFNNQFKGGAIQQNNTYGIKAYKAESLDIQCYFEDNTTAHILFSSCVANFNGLMYGNGTMTNAIVSIASSMRLSGRCYGHTGDVVSGDATSYAISNMKCTETTIFSSAMHYVNNTFANDMAKEWPNSELIDSQWYRTDSAAKIRLNSSGIIQLTTGGEAIDFVDATVYSFAGTKLKFLDAAPVTGTYAIGDFVFNSDPAPGEYFGWVCVTAGTPGTWKGFGTIAA